MALGNLIINTTMPRGLARSENAAAAPITITGVGDIMLDQRVRPPRIFYHFPDISLSPGMPLAPVGIPFANTETSVRWLESLGRSAADVLSSAHAYISIANPAGVIDDVDFPFMGVNGLLAEPDIVVANLECPLTTRRRRYNNDTCYAASPDYAAALARAGIDVVSLANNHCFDYGEGGFDDTLTALRGAAVGVIGAGATLEEARTPLMLERGGHRLAFLAYTMIGAPHIFATADESGVAPFNPLVVAEDVGRAKETADLVIVSVHWGKENDPVPSHRIVELAHDAIDVGADVVYGHHPHVPGAVEIYQGRPIFYSLGNFIFGHTHREWSTNIAATVSFRHGALETVRITPLVGHFGPAIATGPAAEHCLGRLEFASRGFGTRLVPDGGSAIVSSS